MGLFKRKKRRQERAERENVSVPDKEELDELIKNADETLLEEKKGSLHADTKEECVEYISDRCERIMESVRILNEVRGEYGTVSSLLMDVQRIDRAGEKKVLMDAVRKLLTLNRAIEHYRGRKSVLTPSQYQRMERYEEDMPEKIRRMEEEEAQYIKIKSDLRYLEEEKQSIRKEKKLVRGRQKYLKRLSVLTVVFMVIFCILFFAISIVFKADMTIPYMLTVALGAFSGTYIFLEGKKNKAALNRSERMGKRAVMLLNKVKIKYINSTNLLDYYYEKYGTQSTEELKFQFKEYRKAKEDASMYEKNAQKLKQCQEVVKEELKALGVDDTNIWLHQAEALLDEREMVEVRHKLNKRRQKLREQIEYQEKMREESLTDIREFLEKNPSYKPAMIKVLGDYKILV